VFITVSLLKTTLAEDEWTETVILLLKKKRNRRCQTTKGLQESVGSELPI